MTAFKCETCGKTFSRSDALKRHMNIIHCKDKAKKTYTCEVCGIKSAYKANINFHLKKMHGVDVVRTSNARPSAGNAGTHSAGTSTSSTEPSTSSADNMIICKECDLSISRERMAAHCRSVDHREKCATTQISEGVELMRTAFKNRIASYRVRHGDVSDLSSASIEHFFLAIKEKVLRLIRSIINEHKSIKVYFELFGWYVIPTKEEEDGDIRQDIKSFNSEYTVVTISTDLDELYTKFCDILKKKSEEFEVSLFFSSNIYFSKVVYASLVIILIFFSYLRGKTQDGALYAYYISKLM